MNVTTPIVGELKLKLQAWDRDLLASNDLICEWDLDIKEFVRDCKLTNQAMHLQKGYWETSLGERITTASNPEPLKFVGSPPEGQAG